MAVLGPIDQLERMDISVNSAEGSASPSASLFRILRGHLRALMETNSRGLVFSVTGLLLLLIVSTIVLRFAYVVQQGRSHDVLGATYFSVETVATVGYGDYSFAAQDAWFRVFAIALIVLGVTLGSAGFTLFTNVLVSRRIERGFLGRRRVPGMVGHVVVVGLGSVGIRVVEGLLTAGRRVVVVEQDDTNRYLGRARALGVPVVIADATQRQTHTAVNLADASAIAVLTSGDSRNIETGPPFENRWVAVGTKYRWF